MLVQVLPLGLSERNIRALPSFPFRHVINRSVGIPRGAFNVVRRQYDAVKLVHACSAFRKNNNFMLAIIDRDIYMEGVNFLFGLAIPRLRCAIISTYRLKSKNIQQYRSRIIKEAVHELGHLLGLEHCSLSSCVMHFSNTLAETDRKGEHFCDSCMRAILRGPHVLREILINRSLE